MWRKLNLCGDNYTRAGLIYFVFRIIRSLFGIEQPEKKQVKQKVTLPEKVELLVEDFDVMLKFMNAEKQNRKL